LSGKKHESGGRLRVWSHWKSSKGDAGKERSVLSFNPQRSGTSSTRAWPNERKRRNISGKEGAGSNYISEGKRRTTLAHANHSITSSQEKPDLGGKKVANPVKLAQKGKKRGPRSFRNCLKGKKNTGTISPRSV